jgi:hypothetical protein
MEVEFVALVIVVAVPVPFANPETAEAGVVPATVVEELEDALLLLLLLLLLFVDNTPAVDAGDEVVLVAAFKMLLFMPPPLFCDCQAGTRAEARPYYWGKADALLGTSHEKMITIYTFFNLFYNYFFLISIIIYNYFLVYK